MNSSSWGFQKNEGATINFLSFLLSDSLTFLRGGAVLYGSIGVKEGEVGHSGDKEG